MIVDFSRFDCREKPVLVLKNLDDTPISTLGYAFNVELELNYNEISVLQFDIPYSLDGELIPYYDQVVGMRMIDLVGVGQFILVDPTETTDGVRRVKSCKAYSLEYEFTKKTIYLEDGTFNFFDGTNVGNPDTVIGRIAEKMPDWRFDIDESLIGKYRTFKDINKKVYDFIKSDAQESYGCIFDFDTYGRIVHVTSVQSIIPTKQVYLSSDSLIKNIEIEEDSDSIVTCLDVNGADGVSIRSVNPTGTNKIYNIDYFLTTDNFSQEIINKWRAWQSACESAQSNYYNTTVAYNVKVLQILTEQAGISDSEAELSSLENVQAVIIQGISQGINTQENLDDINSQISAMHFEIDSRSAMVEELKAQAAGLLNDLRNINAQVAFENFFTAEEMAILNRYFIEDTVQDSTFVAQTVATYDSTDLNTAVENAEITIADSLVSYVDGEYDTYSFSGGFISFDTFSGYIVSAVLSEQSDGDYVFTAYLTNGHVGDSYFPSGNLTLTGVRSISSHSEIGAVFTVEDGRLFFTQEVTNYEQHQIEWELYEYGQGVLYEHASPTYNFTVKSANFLSLEEFAIFNQQLSLGKKIYLNINDEILQPYVIGVHINYEDPSSFSIEFSSAYTSFDRSFKLTKLLDKSVSFGKTLNYKNGVYSSFVDSGASSKIKEFIDSAVDVAKNSIMSSGEQASSFDDTGIRIRKWTDSTHTAYEPEEIWLVNSMVAFTEDNWATAKMAIGKIFDPNLQFAGNPTGFAYGIAAPYIVGTMVAGQNLIIESTKPDGSNMSFRVDGSGASLYNAKFTLSSSARQIILDPNLGFGIGSVDSAGSIVTLDNNGNEVWNTDGHAKFWVDTNGNVYIKGTLQGCDGTFSGTLSAATGTFSGELSGATGSFSGSITGGSIAIGEEVDGRHPFEVSSSGQLYASSGTFSGTVKGATFIDGSGRAMTNSSGQFLPGYLDLKGLVIHNDDTGQNTLVIDGDGNITMRGNITLGPGSSISWSDIDTDGIVSELQESVSAIGTAAANAQNTANSALTSAGQALSAANQAITAANSVQVPGYIKSSHIDAAKILSPQIYGGKYYATGQGADDGAAYYIYNGCTLDNNTGNVILGDRIGYLSYDNQGSGTTSEAAERVFLTTLNGVALKIESSGNMSISAAGLIYISDINLMNSITLTYGENFGSSSDLPSNPVTGQLFFQI